MGPALLKQGLLDERDKFQKLTQIRLLSPLLGRGLLTSEGAEWKWQRQACAPMFRHQDLLGFVPVFVHAAEGLLGRWRAAPGAAQPAVQPIDRDVTRATFEVVSATLLPSADATIGPVLEHSIATFQRSGGWAQLYASLAAPRWLLWAFASATFIGWGATLAGWIVTEMGRQPWLVTGLLRTKDAVGAISGAELGASLTGYVITYSLMLIAYIVVLTHLAGEGDGREQ